MTTDLEKEFDKAFNEAIKEERENLIEFCKERDYAFWWSPEKYLDEISPATDDENTCWEQWYIAWLEFGARLALSLLEEDQKK